MATAVIVVGALAHAAAVICLFPAVEARVANVLGQPILPFLLLCVPVFTVAVISARAQLGERPVDPVRRLSGGTLGMLATFATLAILIAWEIDVTSVPLFAFSTDPALFDGIWWFVGFGVAFPTVMGIFLDPLTHWIGARVFGPISKRSRLLAALVVLGAGGALGAGAVAVFGSREIEDHVAAAETSYWAALGEGFGIVLPVLIGTGLTILFSRRSRE